MTDLSKYIKAPLSANAARYADAELRKIEKSFGSLLDFARTRPWVDAVETYGLIGDGVKDNTSAFAKMFAAGGQALFLRRGSYITGKFSIPSNTILYLDPGVRIIDSGVLGVNDRFVNIVGVDAIHIVGWGAKIEMNRVDYGSGEQRHAINIRTATNVLIEGVQISGSGGDGIYIGSTSGPCVNVCINSCISDNNRRQGCSIVSGKRIRLINSEFTNTNGTAPAAGIDVEPNSSSDSLEDIKIIACRCVGNEGSGIEIFLSAWNSSSNYVDLEVSSLYTRDNGAVSQSGRLRPGIDINRIGNSTPCKGRIRIIDAICIDELQAGVHVYDWHDSGPLVELIRPTIINPNQADGTSSVINGGIILHNSGSHTSTPGNIRIIDAVVIDDDDFLNSNSLGVMRISGVWSKTEIHNPKYVYAGANPWVIDSTALPRFICNPELFAPQTGNITITDGRYLGRVITNAGASGSISVTLIQATSARIGWRLSFEVFAAQTLGIAPNGADKIVPLADGYSAGTSIKSTIRGSRLVLECRQAGYWHIVEISGEWAIDPGSGTPPTYTVTNVTTDRSYDANATTLDELADVLGTLINDLRERGRLR